MGARLPVQAGPSQNYGQRKQLEDAQRAVPLLRSTPASGVLAGSPAAEVASTPPPPLDAPTASPDEPLTAGSAYGPGPGPDLLERTTPTRLSELLDRLPATGDLADLRVFARQRGL